MPHVIVEHSANVSEYHDTGALLSAIHRAILDLEVAPVAAVRVRSIKQDEYVIACGDEPNHAYIAIAVRLGPGRDAQTKHNLIETVLDAAEAQIGCVESPLVIAWSLEIQEIDAEFRTNRNRIAQQINSAQQIKTEGTS